MDNESMYTQPHQTGFDGRTVYRWRVLVEPKGERFTWAPTKAAARAKAQRRGLNVKRIEPAREMPLPPLILP